MKYLVEIYLRYKKKQVFKQYVANQVIDKTHALRLVKKNVIKDYPKAKGIKLINIESTP